MRDTTTKPISSSISNELFAGAFAGVIARVVTAPLDLIKIRYQLQRYDKPKYTSMFQAFNTLIKEEGFFALWKGNISATWLWVTYAMIQFGMYAFLKKIGDKMIQLIESKHTNDKRESPRLLKAVVLFLAGAGAGISSTIATYPFDIMRTQFAVQGNTKVFTSMQSFITHTYTTKGIRGFYAGLSPAVFGIAPYMGLNFAIYESLKGFSEKIKIHFESKNLLIGTVANTTDNATTQQSKSGLLSNGVCGGIAGGISKLAVYPLDTIKKRLQSQIVFNTILSSSPLNPIHGKYSGILHCARIIYQTEGIFGFYRGIVPTTFKSILATSITFASYEAAKEFLEKKQKSKMI